jgi:hypothetical protein
VEEPAGHEEVGLDRGLAPAKDLRRDARSPALEDSRRAPGEPEINEDPAAGRVRGDDEVPRVDIAVDQAVVVQVLERIEEVEDRLQESPRLGSRRGRAGRQGSPRDVLARVVGDAVSLGVAEVVSLRDLRVAEGGQRAELFLDGLEGPRSQPVREEDLQGDAPLSHGVVREVDRAVAPGPELPIHRVPAGDRGQPGSRRWAARVRGGAGHGRERIAEGAGGGFR